jgi:anti-sigma regulatory factor (Ser/Thr protein kinase)
MNMHRATFEPVPASARAARQFVGDYLSASDATGGLDLVLVLVSELATNSIVHARTVFNVWVDVTGRGVRVGVDDLDDTLPAPTTQAVPESTGGRGLAMVEAAADRWGVAYTRGGKSAWFEIGA